MECLTEHQIAYKDPDALVHEQESIGDWKTCRSICQSKGAEWFTWNSDNSKCYCKSKQHWEICVKKSNLEATSGETTCSSESLIWLVANSVKDESTSSLIFSLPSCPRTGAGRHGYLDEGSLGLRIQLQGP